MLVSMSVDINAPPEVVWPYLVEPEKCTRWFTALKKFEWTSEQQGGVGSTFSIGMRRPAAASSTSGLRRPNGSRTRFSATA